MTDIYLIFVVVLFALAIADLVVGVSNDAVNFLNSAIGAKVASKRTIMIVAGLGIFIGAAFSGGMMEVARKGIFHPGEFFFEEIMVIFLAVMLTDIILLDAFNTLGMPTSTTVSIVFELLGAAVAVSLVKMTTQDIGLSHLGEYINSEKAIQIIGGILLSVVVSFAVGAIIQYISRLVFSFNYAKRMKYVGAIWSGLAMAAITYFLFIKGLKGATFVPEDVLEYVSVHTWSMVGVFFVFWTVVAQLIISLTKVNILKLIVLAGTFSLAMAFSGNDLVNFIGVPIAGLQSFLSWSGSGVAPDVFSMEGLSAKVATPTLLLMAAGLIMVLTLWFSKKARSVTATSLDLSRQFEGMENFSPNLVSRTIVRLTYGLGKGIDNLLPSRMKRKISRNFAAPTEPQFKHYGKNAPSFDLVRAAVNLTVASILISLATSLKLPLSTTYVTFMVAMGASFSDRAWGRESAVYRVSGVISVIGGWFMTALIAFSVSAIFALLIFFFKGYGVAGLLLLAIGLMGRSFLLHKKKESAKKLKKDAEANSAALSSHEVVTETSQQVAQSLLIVKKSFSEAIEGLVNEDRALLGKAKDGMNGLKVQNDILRSSLYPYVRRINEDMPNASKVFLRFYDLSQDLMQSSGFIIKACASHVENIHQPLRVRQKEMFFWIT